MQKIFKSILSLCLAVAICFGMTTITNTAVTEYVAADAATADSYYSSITATGGTELLGQLHDLLTDTHTKYTSYNDVKTYSVKTDPGSESNTVMEFYTHIDIDNSKWDVSGGWNREHVWAKSLSNGCWDTSGGGSDLHHIRPAEKDLNNHRGNMKYGEVTNGTEQYTSVSHVLGGYSSGSSSSGTFEPLDNVKGDVARIVMYVYTQYNKAANVNGTAKDSSYFGKLNFTHIMSASSETAAEQLLLKWNKLDPVDSIETLRNEEVYKIQGNRNPFIDNSSYAEAIWGNGTVVDPDDPTPSDTLKSISLNETALNLNVGDTYNLTVIPNPGTASKSVTWTSSNPSVATVSNGKVTAKVAGTATITATSTSNSSIKATATVTVKQQPSSETTTEKITITRQSFTNASGSYGTYSWSADGIGGTAYIYGGNSDTMQFNTSKISQYLASDKPTTGAIKKVTVNATNNTSWELLTSTQPYGAFSSGNPQNGNTHDKDDSDGVTWTVSGNDTYFALVLGGSGASYISSIEVEYGTDGSVVTPPELQSIAINPPSVTLEEGDTVKLTVESVPSTATAEVDWTSSDPSIATVSSDGMVTAISAGTVTITATSTVNSEIEATATVTVKGSSTPTPSDTFEAGTYKISIDLAAAADIGKVMYFNGDIANSYYLGTTDNEADAAEVEVEEVTYGYTLKSGGQYIEVVMSNDHFNVVLSSNSTGAWKYDSDLKTVTWRIDTNGKDYYLGTRTNDSGKTYTTISASETKYITGDNADKVGVTQFVIKFEKVGGTTPVDPDTPLESIVVNPSDITLEEGETYSLSVVKVPADATADIVWTSSDMSVATVSSDGTVTAVKAGTAIIIATDRTNSEIFSAATVTVTAKEPITPPAETLEILPNPIIVKEGNSFNVSVEGYPDSAIIWSSSDETVAVVDRYNNIVGQKVGQCVITATLKSDPTVQGTAQVTVIREDDVQVSISHTTEIELQVGETEQLQAIFYPSDKSVPVSWSSSDESVVTVDSNGLITAVGEGTAKITVTSNVNPDIYDSQTVWVKSESENVKKFVAAFAKMEEVTDETTMRELYSLIVDAAKIYNTLNADEKASVATVKAGLDLIIDMYNSAVNAANSAAVSAEEIALRGAGCYIKRGE